MELVLATRNAHKAEEFGTLLDGHTVLALPDAVELPPEVADSFAGNALIKARAVAAATGLSSIGDDSGILAAALDGAPGVRSARFAGEHATDAENLALIRKLAPVGSALAYRCALAFVDPDGQELVVEADCTGTLAPEPRGDGGFGYDPIFLVDGDPRGRTMAELSAREKDAISHRGRAVLRLAERIGL
jgi:XTP/dITP diphosphohydrolase